MLDKRAQILLKTLVERYISEGQPVGSRTLSKYSGLDLSPATIRNVMADLEDLGFIESPHTSAGRIPTALGYRFFIDTLLTIQPLADLELNHLQKVLNPGDPQTLVASASQLLSDLSHFVGLVMIPRRPGLAFRHIEFLALSEKRVLLILVTTDGKVQNRIIFSDKAFSDTELTRASNFFNQHYSGCTLDEVRRKMQQELKQIQSDMTKLMDAALEASSSALQPEPEDFVISGQHNLLHVPDLSFNIVNLRTLFDAFEQKTTFIQLLSVSQQAQGVQIFLGGESGRMPVDACSMVTAPYEVDGEVVGTVGVIGPTRMAYDRVIPIVDITAKLLSSALSYH